MIHQSHIMFVDDDEEDRLIMAEYFKDHGKEQHIRFITNGQEALNYLDTIPEGEPLPRLIVLDLNMPILNGSQTLFQLKRDKRFKDIPVIIFSTSENENEKRKCLSLGAHEYLVKPASYKEGLKVVEKFVSYLDGPQSS